MVFKQTGTGKDPKTATDINTCHCYCNGWNFLAGVGVRGTFCGSASTYLPIWKSFPRCEILVESNAFPPTMEARALKPASPRILTFRTWAS